jgi:ribosomal protein S18 acetylase RimI-like enzyme
VLAFTFLGYGPASFERSESRASEAWRPENLNREYLLQWAKPDEFFVGKVGGVPAVAAIVQREQTAQDWSSVDKGVSKPAIYVHWLAVSREFSGHDLPAAMMEFATMQARSAKVPVVRVDTNASETKLRSLYERLGFHLVGLAEEGYRTTALFEMPV